MKEAQKEAQEVQSGLSYPYDYAPGIEQTGVVIEISADQISLLPAKWKDLVEKEGKKEFSVSKEEMVLLDQLIKNMPSLDVNRPITSRPYLKQAAIRIVIRDTSIEYITKKYRQIINTYYQTHYRTIHQIFGRDLDLQSEQYYYTLALIGPKLSPQDFKDERLNSFEDTYGEKQFITIKELFDKKNERTTITQSHRISIAKGRAGIGKSTLVQYLAYQFSSQNQDIDGNYLQITYDWIFVVRLRDLLNLLPYTKQSSGSWVLWEVIYKCCLGSSHAGDKNEFRKLWEYQIEATTTPERILFVLDGYDEMNFLIRDEGTHPLILTLRELIHEKLYCVLITSRPHGVVEMQHIGKKIEVMGFNDDHIEAYVSRFFNSQKLIKSKFTDNEALAEALITYLSNHHYAWAIAHVPLLLSALCQTHKNGRLLPNEKVPLTLTSLYETMLSSMQDAAIERSQSFDPKLKKKLSLSDCTNAERKEEISTYYKLVNEFLSLLAYNTLFAGSIPNLVISPAVIDQSLDSILKRPGFMLKANTKKKQRKLKTSILKQANELGIIINLELSTEKTDKLSLREQSYEYIHLSFQEFYVAIHIVNKLVSADDKEELIRLITHNKYDPRYEFVFCFASGLLKNNQSILNQYIKSLTVGQELLIGQYPLYLNMSVLDECCLAEKELTEIILNQLTDYITSSLESSKHPEWWGQSKGSELYGQWGIFFNKLLLCYQLLQQTSLVDLFKVAVKDKSRQVRIVAIVALSEIRRLYPNLVEVCIFEDALQSTDQHDESYISLIKRGLLTQKEWVEVRKQDRHRAQIIKIIDETAKDSDFFVAAKHIKSMFIEVFSVEIDIEMMCKIGIARQSSAENLQARFAKDPDQVNVLANYAISHKDLLAEIESMLPIVLMLVPIKKLLKLYMDYQNELLLRWAVAIILMRDGLLATTKDFKHLILYDPLQHDIDRSLEYSLPLEVALKDTYDKKINSCGFKKLRVLQDDKPILNYKNFFNALTRTKNIAKNEKKNIEGNIALLKSQKVIQKNYLESLKKSGVFSEIEKYEYQIQDLNQQIVKLEEQKQRGFPVVFTHAFIHRTSDAYSVHIVGDFNNWLNINEGRINVSECDDLYRMQEVSPGLWEVTLPLIEGRYEFKYAINGGERWEPDENSDYCCLGERNQNSVLVLDAKSLFLRAVQDGEIETVKSLITGGVNINLKDEQQMKATPLHHAVASANQAIVELLLQKGANTTLVDTHGQTALFWAEAFLKATERGDEKNAYSEIIKLLRTTEREHELIASVFPGHLDVNENENELTKILPSDVDNSSYANLYAPLRFWERPSNLPRGKSMLAEGTKPGEFQILRKLLLQGNLPEQKELIYFREENITGDGNCGFTVLGADRQQVADTLHTLSNNQVMRESLNEEIREALMTEQFATEEGTRLLQVLYHCQDEENEMLRTVRVQIERLPHFTEDTLEKTIDWLNETGASEEAAVLGQNRLKTFQAEDALLHYCKSPVAFRVYVNELEHNQNLWLGYKSALLYAKTKGIALYIWIKSETDAGKLILQDHVLGKDAQIIHMLSTGGFTHFNLLVIEEKVLKEDLSVSIKEGLHSAVEMTFL